MGPSRRKNGNKAAAAAARLKWKVGDLVLAKVKGFPAWPATVSEPQKWGYPADLKKVLVFFFGTQQIAFCNPADVEEFTEEKKVSLLGKRHGKGSDFVRALNEIIDCFEKLKKQDQVTSDNITAETNIANQNNSDESLTKYLNDEAPVITQKQICSGTTKTTNDLNSLSEAALAAAAEDALHDGEMQLEDAHANSVFTGTRVYSTRSKTDAAQSRKVGTDRRIPARRLRSSSRIDARRPQNLMSSSMDNARSSRRMGTNALHDRSLRRSKRVMKSSDDSEGQDAHSPAFASNDSIEDNDSEIMTVDSDTSSFNDGSSVDSGCKPMGAELFNENNEGETELSDRLDFQAKATIVKKKRKPTRKRDRNDVVLVAKLVEAISEAKVLNTECVSPSNSEEAAERYAKEDGDEHLPLVKRARVRMGRPSPAGDEEVTLVHEEEKTCEVPAGCAKQPSIPLNCESDASADGESIPNEGDLCNSPILQASPARKPQYWETRKDFVDGESALPPLKRLHRALEAMSANAAEDSQRASSCSPTVTNRTSGGSSSSSVECSELSTGKNIIVILGSGQEDHSNGDPQSSACKICVGSNMEVPENDGKTSAGASDCGKTSSPIGCSNSESCKDSFEHLEVAGNKRLKSSPLNESLPETGAQHEHANLDSTNIGKHSSHLDCNTPCLIISPDGCKINPSELNEPAKISDPDISKMNSDSILVEEIPGGSLNIDKAILTDSGDDETPKMKHLGENNQDRERSGYVEEARPASRNSDVVPSATPVKVFSSGRHGCVFQSSSVSDDHLEDRVDSVSQSSSHMTDGPDSVARASPLSSSVCNISASDNNNCVVNNSSCSPDIKLHLEKAKLASKSSSKVESLSSFESMIRSLTRTKDSIGRTTRIAIDCAKFGFSAKVVEILVHNLETESSPQKKVDLFFLVDSITQCSGGMKGDAGIYPSAIQALLPRLLLAAAPPGSTFYENHRQCLKVLRVWLERKILPEPIIRHHIRELDALYGAHLAGGSRRAYRFERSFDDPIREMEGMNVDEYGSNSSIQLPGFCMPPMLRDDDVVSDSDGESFEAVTPEHNVEIHDGETSLSATVAKRSHILEDVDGELEMEDVAPNCEAGPTSTSNNVGTDCIETSLHQSGNHYGAPIVSQQPKDTRPISAPLPRSPLLPPPHPPPPPPPPHSFPPSSFPPAGLHSVSNGPDVMHCLSSQEPIRKESLLQRGKPRTLDSVHHCASDDTDSRAQLPREMPDCSSSCPFSDQPNPRLSGRACNRFQPVDGAFSKGYHLRPPHPSPSNQFSYVQERQIQSRRENSPPSHHNRFHTRHAENGNFYRDRDRNKFASRDNIGEYWRPPLPSISGSCYHDNSRMAHAPMSYYGLPREPALPDNRWNFPSRSMSHRHSNPYRAPSGGPIPVANRGPNFWKPG